MSDLKKLKVLVTPTSYGKCDQDLIAYLENQVGKVIYNRTGRPLNQDELIEMIAEVDGCIAGLDEYNQEVFNTAKNLKVISRYGVGVDNVDLEAARKRGVVITNTPGANSSSVAELTILLILLLSRQVCQAHEKMKNGEWPRLNGLGLEDKTVGIIGLGAIGKLVAERLSGFKCKILACDIAQMNLKSNHLLIRMVNLDTLLAQSDLVTLHIPVTSKTRNLVDGHFLRKMKTGAFIINTARGELIDEKALIEALENKTISGAALDSFQEQPLPKDHPFLGLSQVITTPHMGAHTDTAIRAMGWTSTKDCLAVLKGEKPGFPVS